MVTVFKNFNEVVEHKTISTILEEIKTGKYRPGIIYLRKSLAENKTEAYNKAKKSLPAFTPSGKFVGGRKLEFLADYSSCIILDIDKLSAADLQNAKHLANQSEFTFASFIASLRTGTVRLHDRGSESHRAGPERPASPRHQIHGRRSDGNRQARTRTRRGPRRL